MKLSELKENLKSIDVVNFKLPNGNFVPQHFHVTELGVITKHFIDCGGTVRKEESISIQLWEANDYDHRLKPEKLLKIIDISEKKLLIQDSEIEVEYQNETISKYALSFDGTNFILMSKNTSCLASDACGIENQRGEMPDSNSQACCGTNSGCC